MATKSQRKKQKQKRDQRKRLRQRRAKRGMVPANVRHQQRIAQQRPRAWDGELPEDVAVFEDSVLETLSPELSKQVSTVREALQCASESRGDEALRLVSDIPRSSPLSQWRLFVRGLVSWLSDEWDAAGDVWKRLASDRRPARIATAMMSSIRTDLDQLKPSDEGQWDSEDAPQADLFGNLDDQLLYHARLLRRVRIDRAAIRVAEAGVRAPEEAKGLLIGPKKMKWLRGFAAEYRSTEPEVVAALEQVALGRAFCQTYSDLFEDAVGAFVGPRHDRKNSLLSFYYYMRFKGDHKSDERLQEYVTKDLEQNKSLSEPLRNALVSQVHLNEALNLLQPAGGGIMAVMLGGQEDSASIKRHFQASRMAYPANRAAHKEHVDWIESKLDNDRLTKTQRKPLENNLAVVMQNWSKALPDDVEPRLWLVDHLLEAEETEKAKPHVDWLAASRQDDPHVRASPWKWQLLEAMRLSRRKTWLSGVPNRLETAESQWPSWLSKQWLPYLKAAWTLRNGKVDEFEQQRQRICNESGLAKDSLADACMMLGAAQRMRVVSSDLKPLRAPVDAAVKQAGKIPYEDLLAACAFFWDLHRARLLYPAYRMHGGKFAKELFSRLDGGPGLVLNNLDDERVQAAVLLFSEHRFWSDGYELNTLPDWYLTPAVKEHPMFIAAQLNAFLKLQVHWRNEGYIELGPNLREAAESTRDPYYRHWFGSLADQLDEVIRNRSDPLGSGFDAFRSMFGYRDDGDDDDDDSWDFNPKCGCASCRAKRRAHEML